MRAFTVRSSDIDACPRRSLLPSHYHDDGVCKCVRPDCVHEWRCPYCWAVGEPICASVYEAAFCTRGEANG